MLEFTIANRQRFLDHFSGNTDVGNANAVAIYDTLMHLPIINPNDAVASFVQSRILAELSMANTYLAAGDFIAMSTAGRRVAMWGAVMAFAVTQ